MKNDKGNRIDNYFYEGLDNLNVIPPADVWNNIAENLPRKSNNRAMFIWIAAASITLFAAVGSWMYFYSGKASFENTILVTKENTGTKAKNSDPSDITVIESQSSIETKSHSDAIAVNEGNNYETTPESEIESGEKTSTANKNATIAISDPSIQDNNQQVVHATLNANTSANASAQVEVAEDSEITVANTSVAENQDKTADNNIHAQIDENAQNLRIAKLNPIELSNIPSPEQGILSIELETTPDSLPRYEDVYAMIDEPQDNKGKNRWAIGGQMAPLYSYRNITEVNAPGLTKASMNEIEKAVVTYSSGIIVDYEASSRLTFQTGVSYMKMGQEINNVSNFTKTDTKSAYLANVSKEYARSAGNPVTNSTGTIVTESVPLYFSGSVNADFMSYAPGNLATQPADLDSKNIEQSFEFIEVPFLAKYKIINRKINVHLLGGVSTNFLVNNKSILKSESETVKGKTTDVEKLNYSSSLGFGVAYKLSRNLMLSVEPTFKYYLNSFNSTDAVKLHPYAFGVYSGLSFKF